MTTRRSTAPKAKRTNTSIELSARKKFSNNWQFLTSYVWSRLEGNYDGTFQNSTGQLDPNINSAFDYADFLVNADGRLSNERVHQWKLDGSYEVRGRSPVRAESRPVDQVDVRLPAERVRSLVPLRQLGVPPRPPRFCRSRAVGLGSRPPGELSHHGSEAASG